MGFREIEKIILNDGWQLKNARGSHNHYVHLKKTGKVIISLIIPATLTLVPLNQLLSKLGCKKLQLV